MRKTTFAVLFALSLSVPALAAGPNGGKSVVVEGHPVEFVDSDKDVTFFIAGEDGKPLDTAGLSGKAFVTSGGKTETLTLKAAPPNTFVGTLSAPLAAGTKVVLSAKVHGHNLQARFEK